MVEKIVAILLGWFTEKPQIVISMVTKTKFLKCAPIHKIKSKILVINLILILKNNTKLKQNKNNKNCFIRNN